MADSPSTKHNILLMQSRARALFLHHPHAIFELDPQGRFRHANPAAGRFANLDEKEGQGLHFSRFLDADDAAQVERHFQRAVSGRPSRCETTINTPDGQRLRARLYLLPVACDNHVTGVYVLLEEPDESPRERLVSPATRRLVEAMPVGVALLDLTHPDYPIQLCNQALCQLLNLPRERVEGRPLPVLLERDSLAVRQLHSALFRRQPASERLRLTHHGGKPVMVELCLRPVEPDAGDTTEVHQMLALHLPLAESADGSVEGML